ncbi:MAG: cytochrome B [Flammeovirgaceae bacterium]
MHSTLLLLHSLVRYFVLIFLILLIVRSLIGWQGKSSFSKRDDQLSLWLFMFTHLQLLIGLILFFVSPAVIFSKASMADRMARYWLVEHNTGMIVAIVLITMARVTMKKMKDDVGKFKRLFIFNALALLLILVLIAQSQRGFFSISW